MAYRHNDATYKHNVRARKFRKAAIVAIFGFFVLGVGIAIDWFVNNASNSDTIVSTENKTSVQSANVSVYRTEYFQFQASEEWVSVVSESTDKKFVYVKNTGTLITQRIIVYIDRPEISREADFKITNVLPIEVNELGNYVALDRVSSHCDDSWPEGLPRNPSRITHENVSFVCSPSSKQYNVLVGVSGGSDLIPATLQDGRKITLTIVYSNLTAYPTPGDIYNIVSSFNTL